MILFSIPRYYSLIFRVLIVFVALFILFHGDLLALNQLANLNGKYHLLICGAIFLLIAMFMQAIKWWLLVIPTGIKFSFLSALNYTYIGFFTTIFIPGGIGGDVARIYYFTQDCKDRKLVAICSIVLDRLIGLYTLIVVGGLFSSICLAYFRINETVSRILYFNLFF